MNNDNNAGLVNHLVRRMRGVYETDNPHSSRDGRVHPKEVRELVMQMILNGGIETVKTPEI